MAKSGEPRFGFPLRAIGYPKAIKAVNQVMADLLVEKHLHKTFIGRRSRGFDFLGYWFSPYGKGVAQKTVVRCLEKVSRLYEQGASVGRIGEYLGRWWQWVRDGVELVKSEGNCFLWGFVGVFHFC
ncbi:hypothetical protein [Laspinema olomoucense]|uniref:hypothetical protein n=1 Tax=Laspinema olomoucense TaxID=3231600 RepID=UPI0021BB48F3|nr:MULTISPECIES: hypothetical protein [unclassified Laspinema]MCT7975710.1 hypothetical protein [Laspinema sp. D3d]MCT7997460.1 hypothetical protein [Laspinema sp. D3c]